MKVAVVQLAPGRDREENVERSVQSIREAAGRGAQLVILPELCASPYLLGNEPLDTWAEEIPTGRTVSRWLDEARKAGIIFVAGILERRDGRYYNTAVVLAAQGLIGRYSKTHLFEWERRRLTAGSGKFLPLQIEDARIGIQICYDLRFPEPARLLALAGTQVLCVPTTWTDIRKPRPWDRFGFCGAAHQALGHAYANRIFVLCAGRGGSESGVRYLGNSLIASAAGELLAGPMPPDETGVLIAEIEPCEADRKRINDDNDLWADRREDLYSLKALEPDH